MTDRPTTVVRHQVLDVEVVGTEADGRTIHDRLPDLYERVLRPALDDALGRWARPGLDLAIERLDVDAGTFRLDVLEHELGAAIVRSVDDAVARLTPPGSIGDAVAGDETADRVQHRTEAQTLGWALASFLRTGRLPWWFRIPHGSDLERELTTAAANGTALGGAPGSAERRALVDALGAPTARARLVRQFTPRFRSALLSELAPAIERSVGECVDVLTGPDPMPDDVRPIVRLVWEAAFEHAVAGVVVPPSTLVAVAWARSGAGAGDLPAAADRLHRRWPDLAEPAAGATRLTSTELPDTDRSSPPRRAASAPRATDPRGPITDGADSSHALADLPDDGVYLANAGLVLLHPFLPQLFDALGVTVDDEVTDPDRACCALHLLATGALVAPEHELVLAKVLCGIDLDRPIDADVGLTTADEAEVTALLEAVVGHWDALRDTSPDGLRGTFLLRSGKLSTTRDGDWRLQVEEQGVDVLLDLLPWGIGMVQLPWMDRMLHVEWGARR